jgi:hypothetical protein
MLYRKTGEDVLKHTIGTEIPAIRTVDINPDNEKK